MLPQALRRRLGVSVTITDPPADVVVERDVEVPMRDGVALRANVFRPVGAGPYPVVLCAHPYGKDKVPRRRGPLRGYPQYRAMPQSRPIAHSAWTGWEAPDPAYWVSRGYAVVNADLRGWGRSDGTASVLSAQEGEDGHDLVEWIAAQPWCTGRVGMSGVSYLAIAQWRIAATRPPHLAAICPWEGFTDAYRDLMRPGGVRETGFSRAWAAGMAVARRRPIGLLREQRRRPEYDAWWAARDPDLESIEVPALVCGSFSDHLLHSRGSFEGFRRISSQHKWLYTHRGPKWATYYSPEGLDIQTRFFDRFLRGDAARLPDEPRVRVEVREDADTIASVHGVASWPPPGTRQLDLHLAAGRLAAAPAAGDSALALATPGGSLSFTHRFERDTEVVGPMSLRLRLEVRGGGDAFVFAGMRKLRDGREVGFEGSYGFRDDLVTHGMLRAAHRRTDAARSLPWQPFHPHAVAEPLQAGEIADLDIAMLPSATLFRAGEELRLDVQGRWFFPRDPLRGPFPAGYDASPRADCLVHTGGSVLSLPVLASPEPWPSAIG